MNIKTKTLVFLASLSAITMTQCGGPKEETVPGSKQQVSIPGGVAYYPFNGTANDAWGGHHGSVDGPVLATDRFGNANSAYQFDGENDFIAIPININPEKMPVVTLVAWANASESSPIRQVVSHDNGGFDRSIGIDDRGGGHGWSVFCGSGEVLGFYPVTEGKWVFIAAVYNQNESTVKFYVNDAVFETTGSCETGHDTTYIGMNPSYGEFFAGMIDDVRIYDRVLTQEEIKLLYEGKE
ncbi:LamG domain-containing protein [candidate division WOR-3 bacterium]|nr:LamG domain-containing protein [candidate division WOR-3 bacterium]